MEADFIIDNVCVAQFLCWIEFFNKFKICSFRFKEKLKVFFMNQCPIWIWAFTFDVILCCFICKYKFFCSIYQFVFDKVYYNNTLLILM